MRDTDVQTTIQRLQDRLTPVKVLKPDGEVYCEFSVDENHLVIRMPGWDYAGGPLRVYLDRKVIPDLKKFLETLE